MSITSIEWTDRTWNPTRGCSRISPGCKNCYAEKIAARFSDPGQPFHLYAERKPQPHWTGKVGLIESKLHEPYSWRKPSRCFVNSMSDLFHEGIPDDWIDEVFAVMACCPLTTFQILTKRADRMERYFKEIRSRRPIPGRGVCTGGAPFCGCVKDAPDRVHEDETGYCGTEWPLRNVWLGVSVENQEQKKRIDHLRRTPATVRFLSCEPLLEDLGVLDLTGIDWDIAGAESGPNARPCDEEWVRSIKNQCVEAGVPCFYKQAAVNGRKIPTPVLDGRTWTDFPEVTR